jgi:lipopolysaccharide transport system ATP-binding protein
MSATVISVQNVSKCYRLGLIGGATLRADFERWWARVRGKPDPLLKIGQGDQGNREGEYIWALQDVSFEVQQGEVLGIIGRNGAGKSTLLKILSRVTAPTSGQVKIKGRVVSLLEVGTGFHPELTGRENIYLNGAILGIKKAEIDRKFDEIVAFSEVEKFIDTPVKRYSSGMYVRLAFAVAAHLEPEILLVDEVLAVGDTAFQKKCLGKMGDVAKEGRTVLFVSHNTGAIAGLCKYGVVLESGRVSFIGEAQRAISKYLSVPITSGHVDLGLVANRTGNGRAQFVRAITRNCEGQICDTFVIGDDIHFDLSIHEFERVRTARISVQIVSAQRIPVYHFLAEDAGFELTDISGEATVRVSVENQKMYPGEYHVNLWLGDSTYERLDMIIGALRFYVVEGGIVVKRQLDRTAALVHDIPKWARIA